MKRTLLRSFALVTALTVSAFSTALAGPPWIAIEYPANPFDRTSRDAFLTVRTYHHGDLLAKTVTGTAEGVVNGKRQSMKLDIRPGSQAGTYAVRWQRPATGRWVLVISSGGGNRRAAARSCSCQLRDSDCQPLEASRKKGLTMSSGLFRLCRRLLSAQT